MKSIAELVIIRELVIMSKWICIAILLFPAASWAEPTLSSVSGEIDHGNTVTIDGLGFGTKAQAAPLQWDDFEDGTPGVDIPNGHTKDFRPLG